jgi:hypothetical protein
MAVTLTLPESCTEILPCWSRTDWCTCTTVCRADFACRRSCLASKIRYQILHSEYRQYVSITCVNRTPSHLTISSLAVLSLRKVTSGLSRDGDIWKFEAMMTMFRVVSPSHAHLSSLFMSRRNWNSKCRSAHYELAGDEHPRRRQTAKDSVQTATRHSVQYTMVATPSPLAFIAHSASLLTAGNPSISRRAMTFSTSSPVSCPRYPPSHKNSLPESENGNTKMSRQCLPKSPKPQRSPHT